jgi:ParB-like chromosome segregation protein Spo0J
MKTKQVPIEQLSQDPSNVRRHSERNLSAIVASLRKFGQQKPIVIDGKGIILAGNGTYEAAKRLGWDTIAVVQTDLKGSEATAYAIADNRTAELAEWDETALAETLRALQSEEFEIEAAGFTNDEVDGLITRLGNEALIPEHEGKEYDESVANDVVMITCPKCSHEFPK